MIRQKSPPGHGGQGIEQGQGNVSLAAQYHYSRCAAGVQPRPFSKVLSLRLDAAVSEAEACHTACLASWTMTRKLATEAMRLANLRDRWRAEIVKLEVMVADGEDNNGHSD